MSHVGVNIIKTDNGIGSQTALWNKATAIVDVTHYRGLRFFCNKSVLDGIRVKLNNLRPGICFLGAGDFHHISLALISNLPKKPILILFDNHTDMIKTFPGMISCGSWVIEAIQRKKVKKCIAIGVNPKDPAINIFKSYEKYIKFFPWTFPLELVVFQFLSELHQSSGPIYISIDKDVLCRKDAVTNWDQGYMRLEILLELLRYIIETGRVIGVDVCGECTLPIDGIMFSQNDKNNIQINQRANLRILKTLTN